MSMWCLVLPLLTSTSSGYCPEVCYCNEAISTVDCSGSSLRAIPPLTRNFTHLVLTRSNISYLPKGSFCWPNRLTDVFMDETGLLYIEPGAFRGLTHLLSLSLRHNAIHDLTPGVFEGLDVLEELRLDGNRLQSVNADIFLSTPYLHKIVLDNNLITVVTVSMFSGLVTLRVLSVSHNFIGQEERTLQHVVVLSLESLDLTGNYLEDFDVVDSLATSLSSLKASYNNIRYLSSTSFANMPALQRVFLSGNRIEEIRSDTFEILTTLVILDLSENRLTRLDPDAFVYNLVLSTVNLSGNSNLTVPQNLNSKSLKVLDVSGCKVLPTATECDVPVLEASVSDNIFLVMFLLGIIGTGSILFLFVCTTETLCVCLLNAAVADLLIILVTLPLSAVNSLHQLQDITHCRMFAFTRDIFTGVAVFSVMIHSIERYFTFNNFFTRKLSCFQMFWVWTLAVILALPAYWTSKVNNELCQPISGSIFGSCCMIWWSYLFLYCIAPGFISILLYLLSTRHESRKAEHMATEGILYTRRTRWEVPALTAAFVVSFSPSHIVRLLTQVPSFAVGTSYVMFLSHAWMAPFMLYHSNASVKKIFTQVYGCNCGAQRRETEDAVSVSDATVVQGAVLY